MDHQPSVMTDGGMTETIPFINRLFLYEQVNSLDCSRTGVKPRQ